MAATPLDTAAAPLHDASNSSSSFDFNIYDDGRAFGASGMDNAGAIPPPVNFPPPLLPGGRCNFVDLAQGMGGAQCGCRRFWSRTAAGRAPAADSNGTGLDLTDPNQSGWCMCSHHACFHDHSPPAPPPSGASMEQPLFATSSLLPPSAPALDTSTHFPEGATTKETTVTNATTSATPVLEQENKRPRATNRTPLSPVQDATSFQLFSAKDRDFSHETDRKTEHFLDNISFDFPAGLPAGTSAAFPTGFSTSIGPSFADLIAGATDDPGLRAPPAVPSSGGRNPSAAASGFVPVSPAPPSVTATSVASSVNMVPADGGSIPDTMSWAPNNVGLSQRDTGRTRPPSVFSTQQAPPSVASSTSQRYLRPFAGRGLHTLKHTAASMDLLKALPPPPEHAVSAEKPGAGGGLGATPQTNASSISFDRGDARNSLSRAVQAHETRLEKLENPSFSFFPGHEECQDKHDHIDMRVTELESRVDEVEKRLNNNDDASTSAGGGSIVFTRRRLLGPNDEDDATTASGLSTSISSRVSAAADAAAAATSLSTADRAEIFSQLQSLQTQISLLQSASLPSYNSPWELEVVFLLFPLKGIWIEASQFPTTSAVAAAAAAQRRQAGGVTKGVCCDDDEWTQMPNTLSRQTQDPQPPGAWGAATATDWQAAASLSTTYSDAPRLLPRAYALGRVIDNRLKSRGLVQTLSVRGADARSLQLAIASAFEHVFQANATSPRSRKGKEAAGTASPTTVEPQNDHFLGLQHPWVPLRKVHKDSRLRFLTRAEMLTPTMWDASFLTSSVVMKGSGLQRLYITHPGAYLQDRHAYRCGWSWQRLREMARFPENVLASKPGKGSGGSSSSSNFCRASSVGEGADEPCWAWDSRLDDPPSQSSPSLSSRYRPSPSPFSRGTTPTNAHAAPIHRAVNQQPRHTTATAQDKAFPANQLSRAVSGGASGSAQQFYTVGQSPMAAGHPASTPALRRSMSPFSYSLPPHSRRLTSLAASRPPPLRTVSMPAPPAQERRPSPMAMAVLSPVGRRRVRSDGSRVRLSSSSQYSTRATHDELRRQSTFLTRPSPSPTIHNNDVIHSHNASNPTVVAGGIHKRRRSTRSPSVSWARNTPRRSMSRSSSVVHAAPTTAWAVEKPARSSTPFCYATPYSNAPAADPPLSSSSSARRLWHRDHRGQTMQAIGPYDVNNDYYDDHDMLGYSSEEDLDLDYPMTQDDDDIEVYEDEADDLDDLDDLDTMETTVRDGRRIYQNGGSALARVQERHGAIQPEDEPWPGIEEDDNNEHGHGYASAHSHSQGDVQSHGEGSEGTSSDSENVDPVTFDAEMEEAGVAGADGGRPDESLHESNDINDNVQHEIKENEYRDASPRSDVSSQPSEYPVSRHAWRASEGRDVSAFPVGAWGYAAGGKARLLHDGAFGSLPHLKSGTGDRREGGAVDADMEFQIHEDGDAAVGDF